MRIKYQENTETGRPDVMSFATEGSNDQVRVRMGIKATEEEANKIRYSSQVYRSDGLPTPQSLATIYKFELDDGNILYLGVDTDNKFVELTSTTPPDGFGGRGWHTGGDIAPVDVPVNTGNHDPYIPERPDSSGGFQAHDDNGPVILTTPAPGELDFNDYILITPVADIPAIYVYLSEGAGDNGEERPKNVKMLNDSYLEKNGIDAHELKDELMGDGSNSRYDLYLDKDTGQIWIFRKGGKGSGVPTGTYIK
ncbi:polymorphic toxin type 33 domain-containing protein [Morganella morganii]|uniref:polymorphic toxin type 33 domain-containing protein n=2 Tax=Morganella morganii TaxID=582 RepID=UPI0034E4A7C1